MKKYIKSSENIYATTVSRLYEHSKEDNIAIITAFITSDSDERPNTKVKRTYRKNIAENTNLSKDLQKQGYGFSKVIGHYDETKSRSPENISLEVSYFVICPKVVLFDNFKKTIIGLASKYEQQSVVIWNSESQSGVLYGTEDYKHYSIWLKFVDFDVDTMLYTAWSTYKNHNIVFYEPGQQKHIADAPLDDKDTGDLFMIDSATDLSSCATGCSPFIAARHYRDQLYDQMNKDSISFDEF